MTAPDPTATDPGGPGAGDTSGPERASGAARVRAAIVAVAVAFHLWMVFGPSWRTVLHQPGQGRDFASYYYAVQVAAHGGDPYRRGALARAARDDGRRGGVHPFLYPPPFLLLMTWALPLDLLSAYRAWFWLDEWFAAAAAFALWRWWRPLGPMVAVAVALAMAMFTAVPANHVMGQANFPGLAVVLLGLWLDARGRHRVGGALVGLGCMLKMSPALFVAWWLMKRNWVAAAWAVGAAAALTLASLPLTGVEVQRTFYTEVLPSFGSGDYNGLGIPIGDSDGGRDLFANHSIPNVYHQIWPGTEHRLSRTAQWASSFTSLALVLGLGWLFRRGDRDPLVVACQASAIGVALLVVPVYCYEHHAVWAIPAVVATAVAMHHGRLPRWWALLFAPASVAWAWEVTDVRALYLDVVDRHPLVGLMLQEAKFVALLVFLAGTTWVGGRRR